MGGQPFHFKQFSIAQDQCAMQVGTDGVLLGAWANIHKAATILDVGTGTGLVAIMCAQRNGSAHIWGLEVEPAASRQASYNANNSPWKERLTIIEGNFTNPAWETLSPPTFDHIVCNPPYFNNTQPSNNPTRNLARQAAALDISSLARGCGKYLNPNGKVSIIIPAQQFQHAKQQFQNHQLNIQRITWVKGNAAAPRKRVLLEFATQTTGYKEEELIIEIDRHKYTAEYIALTQAFYWNM